MPYRIDVAETAPTVPAAVRKVATFESDQHAAV
jgi:hypothetical protein